MSTVKEDDYQDEKVSVVMLVLCYNKLQVRSVVKKRPKLEKISFVAHSLGGLVARYAIGRLYECEPKSEPSGGNGSCLKEEKTNSLSLSFEQPCQGKIAGLEPMNFVTVATPHLGSKGHKQVDHETSYFRFYLLFTFIYECVYI